MGGKGQKTAGEIRKILPVGRWTGKRDKGGGLMLTSVMRTWHVDISVTSYLLEGGSASIKGMSPGSATLSPQTTARLASLVNFFFSRTPTFFSLFPQCGAWPQASSRLQDSRESGSRKVARKLLGSRAETRKWSLHALFSVPHNGIPAPGIPCDWSM